MKTRYGYVKGNVGRDLIESARDFARIHMPVSVFYNRDFNCWEVCARGNGAEGAAGRKGKGVEVGRTGGIAKVVVVGTVGYHVQVYRPGAILEVYRTGAVNGHGTELQTKGNGSGAGCLQRSAAAYVNIEQAEVGVGSCSAKGGCSVGKGANKVVAGSVVGVDGTIAS